jgi:hypothetical protein
MSSVLGSDDGEDSSWEMVSVEEDDKPCTTLSFTLNGKAVSVENPELRQRIASGDIVDLLDTKKNLGGGGHAADSQRIGASHNKIKERVLSLTGWGGIEDDSGRQRGYGYLPQTMGVAHYEKGGVCAMKELESDAELVKMDCTANQHASVMLTQEDVDACASTFGCSVEAALGRVVESFRPMVAEQYRHPASRKPRRSSAESPRGPDLPSPPPRRATSRWLWHRHRHLGRPWVSRCPSQALGCRQEMR